MVRLSAGGMLLALGVIGGFVPVMQGWLFILAGLSVMAPESRRARRALDWAKNRVQRSSEAQPGTTSDPPPEGGVSEEGSQQ